MILTLKDSSTIELIEFNQKVYSELKELLITKELHYSDLLNLAVNHSSNFEITSNLLSIIDQLTEFDPINNKIKAYVLASHVRELIKITTYYNENTLSYDIDDAHYKCVTGVINTLIVTENTDESFISVKAYYFLFLKQYSNAKFLIEKIHNPLKEIIVKIIKVQRNERINIKNDVDELCMWYMKYTNIDNTPDIMNLVNIFPFIEYIIKPDPKSKTLEGIYCKLKTVNDIEQLKTFLAVDNSGFRSDIHYLIGKEFHKNKNYLSASKHYKESNCKSAIYNLMRITRNITSNDPEYSKILNYIHLKNGNFDKILLCDNSDPVYKIVRDEKWCGSAILSYYRYIQLTGGSEISYNNLAYFYKKCTRESEFQIIEKFYKLIRGSQKNASFHDITSYCDNYIMGKLKQYNGDISKYNLSFFLPKNEAIEMLESIVDKTMPVLIRLGLLSNNVDMFKELVNKKESTAFAFIAHYHLVNKNIKLAKEEFKSLISKGSEYKVFSLLSLANIAYDDYLRTRNAKELSISQNYLQDALHYDKFSYAVAYNIAVILYEKRKYQDSIKILNEILKGCRREEKVKKMCKNAVAVCMMKIEEENIKKFEADKKLQ